MWQAFIQWLSGVPNPTVETKGWTKLAALQEAIAIQPVSIDIPEIGEWKSISKTVRCPGDRVPFHPLHFNFLKSDVSVCATSGHVFLVSEYGPKLLHTDSGLKLCSEHPQGREQKMCPENRHWAYRGKCGVCNIIIDYSDSCYD